jgi:CO/xanthine dehydrogenase FAD-binding subunit
VAVHPSDLAPALLALEAEVRLRGLGVERTLPLVQFYALPEEDRRIEAARLALGGVAPIPWRAAAAERVLVGVEPGEELFVRAAEAALSDAEPLRHNDYKVPLAKSLIRRALRMTSEIAL